MKSADLVSRRRFLRLSAAAAAGVAAAACQPQTVVVKETVEVEKVVKETVEVEKVVKETVEVEKVVQQTVEVEKLVTALPSEVHEAPELFAMVAAGDLPPVEERMSSDPAILQPVEEIGEYGGTWNQIRPGGGVTIFKYRTFYPNLFRWNVDGTKWIPNVAKEWEVSDEGKTYTFMLRKGMKWSDGQPYTADDLVFYYESVLLNEDLTPAFPSWLVIQGEPGKIEKVDDYTVRFVFPHVHGLFLTLVAAAYGCLLMRYCEHYLKQFHPSYTSKADLEAEAKAKGFEFWYQYFGDRLEGTVNTEVPVIFAWHWAIVTPQNPQVAKRNPYYFKVDPEGNQLPYIDDISVLGVESQDVFDLRSIAGEVSMQRQYVLFKNFTLYQENKDAHGYRTLNWPRGYITDSVIALNCVAKDPLKREIYGDKRFRWALSLGIKRDEIIEAVYLGQAEPNQVSPLPSSPFYWEEQAKNMIEYDPERSNALLDEMGLDKRDAEGYRLQPDGQRLSILCEYYTSLLGPWDDVAELLGAQWKELGIELQIKGIAHNVFYERKAANEHEMMFWTGSAEWNPLIDPRWFIPFTEESIQAVPLAQWWNSGGTDGEEPTGDFRKALELYDQIKATPDQEMQVSLFRQILELNKENLWVIGISNTPPDITLVKNDFRNVPDYAISDWHLLTPGNSAPDQYFIRGA